MEMPAYMVKFSKDEVIFLDSLAAIHRRKPFLKCNSTKVQSYLELFKTTEHSKGFETLIMARLKDKRIDVGLSEDDYFVAFDTSCNTINRIMKDFFKDILVSKRNAEKKAIQKRACYA